MLGIRQWRHRAFCVFRQHRLRHRWPSHRLWIKVYRRWITNNSPCKWRTSTTSGSIELQILAQKDFQPKLLWSENADFKFRVNNEEEDVNNNPRSRRKEHRLAQRRQRRQQETEEQEIGIRGIMIVHCRKPIPADICRSKSAKFQLCITARTTRNTYLAITVAKRGLVNCTEPGFVLCFCLFLNPDAEIMLNLLFYTVNNNTT